MPTRPNQAISSASRRAKRTIDSASPSTSSASLTPPQSSQSHVATTTRSGRSVKRTLPDYTDDSEFEGVNGIAEDMDEDELEDEDESMDTDSVPVVNPLRIKLTVNNPGVKPKLNQSTSSTKRSASNKRKKAEEPPDMDGDMLDDDNLEDEEGVAFGEGGDDSARGSKSPTKMTARQRARGNKDLQEGLLVLEEAPSSRALVLTEQEKLERKEEASRRRRRQVEQKLQDEQDETINRLLRAQTSRSRSKLDNPMDLDGDASAVPSPSRRVQPAPEGMIRWSSKITKEGDVVMRVAPPKEKEAWLDLVGAKLDEVAEKQRSLNRGKGMCDAPGCGEKRKYRSVKNFNKGGCCMEHLKAVEASL
ncbi:ino eighty subunit 2 [Cryptococcus deuterogattii 99/473]|uniref:Ino eighty subunit 2 n=1 Tax=Cryptococcus deuterogattii Ram5 TaxID=1296110 RepID=A0A0D0TW87_9TREE|nr:ino eighty subunit 2 [Cryptococcus deuterogattii LA55]KIR40078.1 ino eighty subunit 2 [Cryptococcus deuterogattii Ram5]KIR91052.1 ino eighty subunit 2 [Cryptococcus deuterogattii CBS 10090]KIR96485.1 ino eighty subunit 2 [Cryptococcus deuterogattii 2001/935-1]KIY55883.1 ino eighty subunit 2 [Cryptococcus deuterogattii 99/473]